MSLRLEVNAKDHQQLAVPRDNTSTDKDSFIKVEQEILVVPDALRRLNTLVGATEEQLDSSLSQVKESSRWQVSSRRKDKCATLVKDEPEINSPWTPLSPNPLLIFGPRKKKNSSDPV